jgi:hypothetical protein
VVALMERNIEVPISVPDLGAIREERAREAQARKALQDPAIGLVWMVEVNHGDRVAVDKRMPPASVQYDSTEGKVVLFWMLPEELVAAADPPLHPPFVI